MKKQYETPKAKKMDFNYEENVVASGITTKDRCTCCTSDVQTNNVVWFLFWLGCLY